MKNRMGSFRALCSDGSGWKYGCAFNAPLTSETWEADHFSSGVARVCISDKDGAVFEVVPETVGANTTRQDIEIYQGDRVEVKIGAGGEKLTDIGVVVWDDKELMWAIDFNDGIATEALSEFDKIKVVGNIHDHPGLDKKGGD